MLCCLRRTPKSSAAPGLPAMPASSPHAPSVPAPFVFAVFVVSGADPSVATLEQPSAQGAAMGRGDRAPPCCPSCGDGSDTLAGHSRSRYDATPAMHQAASACCACPCVSLCACSRPRRIKPHLAAVLARDFELRSGVVLWPQDHLTSRSATAPCCSPPTARSAAPP